MGSHCFLEKETPFLLPILAKERGRKMSDYSEQIQDFVEKEFDDLAWMFLMEKKNYLDDFYYFCSEEYFKRG